MSSGILSGSALLAQIEAETKLKAAGVQFVPADKAAFYKATQPIREKYGSKYAALIKRIEDTK